MDNARVAPPRLTLENTVRATIRRWMHKQGVTQQVLAERIGRRQDWLSRYLAGDMIADLDTLQSIAAALGNHTLTELIDMPADPDEAEFLQDYRSWKPVQRDSLRALMKSLRDLPRERKKR